MIVYNSFLRFLKPKETTMLPLGWMLRPGYKQPTCWRADECKWPEAHLQQQATNTLPLYRKLHAFLYSRLLHSEGKQ